MIEAIDAYRRLLQTIPDTRITKLQEFRHMYDIPLQYTVYMYILCTYCM